MFDWHTCPLASCAYYFSYILCCPLCTLLRIIIREKKKGPLLYPSSISVVKESTKTKKNCHRLLSPSFLISLGVIRFLSAAAPAPPSSLIASLPSFSQVPCCSCCGSLPTSAACSACAGAPSLAASSVVPYAALASSALFSAVLWPAVRASFLLILPALSEPSQ